jgi:hypothetical protein
MKKINAEFMDRFGLVGFIILLFSGIRIFQLGGKSLEVYAWMIILISLIGILVDGYIVFTTFISGRKK